MSKIKLLCNIPNINDATSFYRGIGPISEMMRTDGDDIEFNFCSEYTWATMALWCDVLFMQRPYKGEHLQIVQMAKANGKKVVVDFDDDLFTVPLSNPANRVYGRQDIQQNIARMLAHADVVTVSTPHLKKLLQTRGPESLNKDIRVIPNAYHLKLLGGMRSPQTARRKMILWRGSPTHHRDVWAYLEEIVDLVNTNPDWTFLFQGDKPWFLFERLKDNAMFADGVDPIEYFKMIAEVAPSAMMVPLEDSDFNRSKSNIAWIESVHAGALTIAPDWEEWRRPGVITYKTPVEFHAAVSSVLRGAAVEPAVREATSYIEDLLTLDHTNKMRISVIRELASR